MIVTDFQSDYNTSNQELSDEAQRSIPLSSQTYIYTICNVHKMSVKLAESQAQAVSGGTERRLKSRDKIKCFETAFEGAN